METVFFGIGFLVLVAASWLWAADSRPSIGDGWSECRRRWYPGS